MRLARAMFVVSLCLWPGGAQAQARAGLHGGLSRSALILDSGDSGFRNALIGGGWVRFPIVGAAALQLGAYWAQKGSSDQVGPYTAQVELDYIELPLQLTFLLNRTGRTSGYVAIGGALAMEQGCRLALRGEGTTASVECDAFQELDAGFFVATEDLDVGFVLGGGVEFDRGPIIFTVDTRATFGLREAFQIYPSDGSQDGDDGQNLNLALMAGIAFPIGPRPGS